MSFFSSDSVAPFFRFVMELTSWIWLLFTYWFFAFPSILSLALLNYPGDKKPKEEGVIGLPIPGKLRVLLEVITAILGLFAAYVFIGTIGFILQFIITVAYLKFDLPRLSWMWGNATYPPDYVTQLHKERAKMKNKKSK